LARRGDDQHATLAAHVPSAAVRTQSALTWVAVRTSGCIEPTPRSVVAAQIDGTAVGEGNGSHTE